MSPLFIFLLFLFLPFPDQPQTTYTRQGVVVSPEGKPVARAELCVVSGDLLQKRIAQGKTDQEGRFQISYRLPTNVRDQHVKIIVRDDQKRLGWSEAIHHSIYPSEPDTTPLRIEMRPTVKATGRILAADGKPLVGAKVTVKHFNRSEEEQNKPGRRRRGYEQLVIPDHLAADYIVTTDAQGRFVIPQIPNGYTIAASVNGPVLPEFMAFMSVTEPLEIKVPLLGRFEGKCVGPVEPKLLAGVRIHFVTESRTPQQPVQLIGQVATVVVQPDGTFVVEKALQFSTGHVELLMGQDVPALAEATNFTWNPTGTTRLEVKVQPAAQLKGRIVDKETGKGIGDIRLRIGYTEKGEGLPVQRLYERQVVTTADGNFQLYLPPGKLRVMLMTLPEEYEPPATDRVDERELNLWPPVAVAGGQTVELPLLALSRAATLQGQAVDGQGKPVAGAMVYLTMPDRPGRHFFLRSAPLRADAQGRFTLKGLDPTDYLPIRARSADGTSAGPVIVLPNEVKEPLKLVIKPEQALRLRGQVVDSQGKPVSGAKVKVMWYSRYASKKTQMHSVGRFLETLTADAQGHFASGPLWANEEYILHVSCPSYSDGTSAKIIGREGQTVDVAPIVLTRPSSAASGTIVDTQGKPVAALIFNRAEGPEPVTTRTDGNGTFRLTGLYEGPAFLLIQPDDDAFLPTVAPVIAGSPSETIVVRRKTELPLGNADQAEAALEARRQAVVRKVIDQAFQQGAQKQPSLRMYLALARLDPKQAIDRWGNNKGGGADRIRLLVAEQLLAKDLDYALALATLCDPAEAFRMLIRPAERLAATDPRKATRLAEELVIWARQTDMPRRAMNLASVGSLVGRLGQTESQRKLLDEAITLIQPLGGDRQWAGVRGTAATSLATVDLTRAEQLIAAIQEPFLRGEYRMEMAAALVTKDFDQAMKLHDDVLQKNPGISWPSIKVKMAYRLAAKGDIARALTLANSITWPAYRLEALGWIATLAKDRKQAHQVIDQALNDIVQDRKKSDARLYPAMERPLLAARLAWFAHQVEYPHRDLLLYRAIELRPTTEELGGWNNSKYRVQNNVTLAMLLATVDPATTRHLLLAVEPHLNLLADEHQTGYRAWLRCWALIDPQRAVMLADELAKEKNPAIPEPHMEIADILSHPKAERARAVVEYLRPFWFPERD